MKRLIAAVCCAMLVQGSVLTAADPPAVAVSNLPAAVLKDGPLLRASRSKTTPQRLAADARWNAQQPVANDPDTRSWMERHPVWTGAIAGFAAGFAITYLATGGGENDSNEMRIEASLVFGGVSAGIGALAGWGIGRSHDDGYHNRSRVVTPSTSR